MRCAAALALSLLALALPASAQNRRRAPPPADSSPRVYVVRPGDNLRRVASYLQVPFAELAARNNLRAPYALRIGRRLRLPDGVADDVLRQLPTVEELRSGGAATEDGSQRLHRSGVVTLVRARDQQEMTANFNANPRNLRPRVERSLSARNGAVHMVHPRLLRLLPQISDRFGGRRIVVLSGYRPHRRGRAEERGRHAQGMAVDLRVEGVAARQLYQFCQTLGNVGCGHSPRGDYVHIDVRTAPLHWAYTGRSGSAGDPNPTPEDDVAAVLAEAAQE
ncbi:MAG: DUF882 domain-containing protein [Polyangiales bacterium]